MRQVTAGLAIMALAVTGCAATASTSSSKTPAAESSHSATTATGTSGLGGLTSGGSPAQWVVDGTFETESGSAQPLSGTVTFRDSSTGDSVNVTVGSSGKFSLGLIAGTYTATPRTKNSDSPCSAPVTVTVKAGQQTQVSLVCVVS